MVHRPLSLALRLTLMFGIAAAVTFPIFGWVIFQSTEIHFEDQDSDELKVIADAAYAVLSDSRARQEPAVLERRIADILVGHHEASLYVRAPDGQVLYSSSIPDLSPLASGVREGGDTDVMRDWHDSDRNYRVLTELVYISEVPSGLPYTLVVAVPTEHHLRFLATFRRSLSLLIVASIALMSLMGWIAVRQGHAPLHDIVEQIRRIRANELDIRLSPDAVPAELRELAVSFNNMLERVDEAFHRLSDFNADIAHELRTPIATLMTQTEVGLSRAREADEYREILYSNMEEYDRMAKMVGDMLFLAQSDNRRQEQSFAQFDLANEVMALFEFYEGWAEERAVALALTGTATVTGDRLMLRRALSNLLSNAIRYTPADGTVQVSLGPSSDGRVCVSISNPGPTIPREHIARLFDRFYRIDPSRQHGDQGVGLGLAIVQSIVKAHEGTISIVSANGHTRFDIVLPAHAASGDSLSINQ